MLANKKKIKKLVVRVSFLSIMIILNFFALFMIFKGKQIEEKEKLDYCYKIENKIDYKVYMYDNSFFDEDYLGMNKTYTSDLINYIDINFEYNYSNSKKENFDYNYDITAKIVGNYGTKQQDELWTKNYILKEKVSDSKKDSNSLILKENIKIKYEDYLATVIEFKKQLKLSIDASLEISMNININSDKVKDTQNLKISIPLTETTFKIDLDYKDKVTNSKTNNEKITIDENIKNLVNKLMMKLGIILLIFNIIVFLLTYKKVFDIKPKSSYEIELSKILKRYAEIIVEISSEIEIDENTVISVKKIEDMVDIEEELRMPILYYEKKHKKEAWFIIKHGKDTYRYILQAKK